MSVSGARNRIQSEVSQWDGITSGSHRFGGLEFKLANREIGHVHGDQLVDIPLPKRVRDEVVASAQADPHHVLPRSGWVSVYLNQPGDVERAIEILRRSYAIAKEQSTRKTARNLDSGRQK
jgi:predicted DNA-binding protein (MmcQ/YjbR family)